MSKIPNAITLCNAVCGMLAILFGDPVIGAYFIITAMVLDLADGLVARALNVKSELGKQLDSLADLISFGVAPGYLFYHLFGDTEALLASIFYVLSALFRLAKFNTMDYMKDFNGLPSPAAAGVVSGYILIYAQDNVINPAWLPMAAILTTAICMNIKMGFFSLKGGSMFKDWRLWLVILSTLAALIVDASFALIVCFGSYVLVSFASCAVRNVPRSQSQSN